MNAGDRRIVATRGSRWELERTIATGIWSLGLASYVVNSLASGYKVEGYRVREILPSGLVSADEVCFLVWCPERRTAGFAWQGDSLGAQWFTADSLDRAIESWDTLEVGP